ncbi:Uncharacterised protein [Yersinia enterocolitica]|nr:Uncharacterised protein [Yersinia enterocolitica]
MFKFFFEAVNAAEVALNSGFQVTGQSGAQFQALPEQAVVSVTASVITHKGAFFSWNFVQIFDQIFNTEFSQLREALQHRVCIVNIGLVVFGVMDFHRLLIEVWLQGVISIRQGWQ